MPCYHIGGAIVTITPTYRLRLEDGRHVFMLYHSYCGPMFYRDRALVREIRDWWEDAAIDRALTWFIRRGRVA